MNRLLRSVMMIVSVLALIWFCLPLCLSVSLNLGNVTGIGAALLLLFYALFMKRIHGLFRLWKGHRIKRWVQPVIVTVAGVIAGLVVAESICMIGAVCKEPGEDATVVVLGCRVYGTKASLSMVERLEAAYDYLKENERAVCVLSGGQGSGENITEAECMYRYLLDKGIDAGRLYKEEQSASTRENLEFSRELIAAEGLSPQVAIATSEYHQYRAGRIAQDLGMEYGVVPARTAVWLFPTYYVRELYGILYEWLIL